MWKSMSNGGATSQSYLTSLVSIFTYILTLSGSKGRTLHLLKEKTKRVSKQKKRLKIDLLEIKEVNF